MAASQWMLTTQEQYYRACCPCLHVMDMCSHVGGSAPLGCLAGLFCPVCWPVCLAPKIAAKSGIEESTATAVAKVCCCTMPYVTQVDLEYSKQKKLQEATAEAGQGQWLVSIGDLCRDGFCPCLLGRDMAEHVGVSGNLGCLLGCLLEPALLCLVGPKVAAMSGIEHSQGKAARQVLCPCTYLCYKSSVYAEFRLQRQQQLGMKSSPAQVEMQA